MDSSKAVWREEERNFLAGASGFYDAVICREGYEAV